MVLPHKKVNECAWPAICPGDVWAKGRELGQQVFQRLAGGLVILAGDEQLGRLVEAGILKAGRGKARLLKPAELPGDWDPATDTRLTAWEMVHHPIRVLEAEGEAAAAALVAKLGDQAEVARELAYRLYTICERKKRAQEALSYNGLVQSWPEIVRLAREGGQSVRREQTDMFDGTGE